MRHLLKASGFLASIVFAAFGPEAGAQETSTRYICQAIGAGAPEALGDRDHHLISIDQTSCRVASGPMSGGILTGMTIWEWNGPNAVLVSGNGIVRKGDATVVYVQTEGKVAVTYADGKMTGFTASGKGRIAVATGDAASEAGKVTTWTVAPTGPRQMTVEEQIE
jgi:hypothetical protein